MMVMGRLRPDKKSKYGTKSGRPKVPLPDDVDDNGMHSQSYARRERRSSSLLEQLPAELLQDIFLFSANLHLPLCSKQLLSALTSQHLKFEVALQILVFQQDRLDQENKSLLLSRRFFTWDFLVRYVSFAQPRTAATGDDRDSDDDEHSDEDEGYAVTARSSSSSTVLPPGKRIHTFEPHLSDVDQDLTMLARDGMIELRRHEISHLLEISDPHTPALDQLHRKESLKGLRHLDIPEKLVHNGWDDDRLRLLRLLIAFDCSVSASSTAHGVVNDGIFEAIEQGEEELVSYFLGDTMSVEPTIRMLRTAMMRKNVSIVFQLLQAGHDDLDRLDPQVWNLLEEHMRWTKQTKATVKEWLQTGIPLAVTEANADFLPSLRNISIDPSRWTMTGKKEIY